MRLLLDEMHPPEIAAHLRRRGHDVVHAAEIGLAGRSDSEVLAAIAAQGRAILSNNADDYTRLFRQRSEERRVGKECRL